MLSLKDVRSLPARVATFRNCSIFSIYHLMTFFVILNKKNHVARNNSYYFDFALIGGSED
ncbi:hypothetical protein GAR96_22265 [Salmonella enterica]|nr:hypothetical protein [Salmonella enterica]EBS0894631.1 hypothetical protein [Salmonella enterica subsp. enterica serovar Abaetetuba]ECH8209274.1 hypothetical protein [Salmonella enterica subsp. enterica]EDU0272379.1 hypothetical protein [Salmonella enterica subsp. enterica serovar Glostrup]EAX7075448.1 hypothetical protein [Salmonella enterica]